ANALRAGQEADAEEQDEDRQAHPGGELAGGDADQDQHRADENQMVDAKHAGKYAVRRGIARGRGRRGDGGFPGARGAASVPVPSGPLLRITRSRGVEMRRPTSGRSRRSVEYRSPGELTVDGPEGPGAGGRRCE